MQASAESPWSLSKVGGGISPDQRMPGMVSPEWLALAATAATLGAQQGGPQQNGDVPAATPAIFPQQNGGEHAAL